MVTKNTGITLVALVITIIVLLILAGIIKEEIQLVILIMHQEILLFQILEK